MHQEQPEQLPGAIQRMPPVVATPQRSGLSQRLQELTKKYLIQLGTTETALHEAVSARDYLSVARLAHQMRGSAGMYGFTELGATAGLLEDAIKEQQEDSLIADLTGELQATLAAVVKGLVHPDSKV